MSFLVVYAIAWVVGIIAVLVTRTTGDLQSASRTFLLWQLVIATGVGGLLAAAGHLFMADKVAQSIGWATGSPFQTELAYACLGMGVLGVMCFWYRDGFWLATIVFVTVFLGGTTIVHIAQMIHVGDFAPGNALTVIPDLLGPATLWVLWLLAKGAKERAAG
jgi:hypothetical protein